MDDSPGWICILQRLEGEITEEKATKKSAAIPGEKNILHPEVDNES